MKSLRTARHKVLAQELKCLRSEAKLTQAELAKRLGVTQSRVAKVEVLERRIDVLELVAWLEAMDRSDAGSVLIEKLFATPVKG